jgi:transcriptional regulator with XRE-family HTH domain
VGDFIRHQREVARMSVRRLAELAGVSNPYLSQIERGLRRPSAEILQQIARALHVSAEQLYVRAGILDPESAVQMAVPDAISRDERLTPEQKQSLLTVYESFVGAGSDAATSR